MIDAWSCPAATWSVPCESVLRRTHVGCAAFDTCAHARGAQCFRAMVRCRRRRGRSSWRWKTGQGAARQESGQRRGSKCSGNQLKANCEGSGGRGGRQTLVPQLAAHAVAEHLKRVAEHLETLFGNLPRAGGRWQGGWVCCAAMVLIIIAMHGA